MAPPTVLTRGFNEVEAVIAKTMAYLSIPAVVGHEAFFLNVLYEDFKAAGLGAVKHPGLLEVYGPRPHTAILCAHIDRHGLISIGNDQYVYAAQYIREINYGEENRASRRELQTIAQRFEGERVFAYDSKTVEKRGEGIIETCTPCMADGDSIFYVWGMDEMPLNTPLAYARTARAKDGMIEGQIDNALSLGAIYALFKAGFQGTALLTTEEEIGKSWLHISSYLDKAGLETKDLLVLDTSPYPNDEPLEDGMIVLRSRDKSEKFNLTLTKKLKKRCESLDIPYQIKDEMLLNKGKKIEDLGSTELGRLIQGREGRWSGTTIQIPTNMYHTSRETTTYHAIRNYYHLLADMLIENPLDIEIKNPPEKN